jgi:hypothetical protein
MPRPAAPSYFALCFLLFLPVTGLTAKSTAASQTPPPGGVSLNPLAGIWVLNRDRGDLPSAPAGADAPERGGPRGGRGGVSGGMGRGGQGRGTGGFGQPPSENDVARRQAVMNYVRTATEAPKQLTIVVHPASVSITDADGHVQLLPTGDTKDQSRAENGLIKLSTKNHWDGSTLITEVDIEGGPTIVRTYALSPGGTELQLTTAVGGSGRPLKLLRYYERPVESR